MKFDVSTVDLATKPQNQCFGEVARALCLALIDLGHEPTSQGGRAILFGKNDPESQPPLPANAILFNAEMIREGEEPKLHRAAKDHVIWDYSDFNRRRLRGRGYPRVVHCPIGYHRTMTSIPRAAQEDTDVLFYGWVNERRQKVLDALLDAGLKVRSLFGVYGALRDNMIARSKLVLNLHYYAAPVFEVFRCSHLWANRKCVVTEEGGVDAEIELLAKRACAYVPTNAVVEKCRELCKDDRERRRVAEQGFEVFRGTSMVENVRRALEATT